MPTAGNLINAVWEPTFRMADPYRHNRVTPSRTFGTIRKVLKIIALPGAGPASGKCVLMDANGEVLSRRGAYRSARSRSSSNKADHSHDQDHHVVPQGPTRRVKRSNRFW